MASQHLNGWRLGSDGGARPGESDERIDRVALTSVLINIQLRYFFQGHVEVHALVHVALGQPETLVGHLQVQCRQSVRIVVHQFGYSRLHSVPADGMRDDAVRIHGHTAGQSRRLQRAVHADDFASHAPFEDATRGAQLIELVVRDLGRTRQ